MSLTIKQKEQRRMDEVVAKIKQAEKKSQANIDSAGKDQRAIMNDFKNNVRIKTGTYSGMMETALTVRQQQTMLQERENNWRQATQQLDVLQRLEKTPYFARIDFQENGESKPESVYIGLSSFTDTPDHFLIYDWRAPISSIYYEGGLGQVSYETPDGRQNVELTLKRQFMVEDGTILTVFDTDETVGDQMLLEVLDESSDTKMKSIVSTIQKEQNKIIRDTKSDLLFVQGAAGSGKTSAVLQRVAFLLYRYRGNLNSSQVILFSPNQLFNDYINEVLPELGEQNMVQMTFYQYAKRRVPRLHVETLQERFEESNDEQERKAKNLKDSLSFFKATNAYADFLNSNGMHFKNIMFHGKPFFSKEQIKDIYYSFNSNYNLRNRLAATRESLLKKLSSKVSREARTERVQKAVQGLGQDELNDLYGDHPRNFANGDKEITFLTREYVTREFQTIKRAITRNRFININGQYAHFLRHLPDLLDLSEFGLSENEWQKTVDKTIATMKNGNISLTDVTAYLYLFDQIIGKRGDLEMRQVFIDEIQDYSAYQLALLKEEFPRAKFTMLGDLNQSIFTQESSHSLLNELSTMFEPDKTQVVQLTKSYRSTQQITDFSKDILHNGEEVEAFDRAGDLPTVTVDSNEQRMVQDVAAQLDRNKEDKMTTAIITKSLQETEELTFNLKELGQSVTAIKTENQRLVPGTIIVPSYLAKGLEFDAIIVWNANEANYHREDERQLVYTICSRAMHRLNIFSAGKLTPLMADIPAERYELIDRL
ncbi:RNA polymerase recycling motor HelD [Ligilactobacillus acidipiscis]|uniref:RNA polymerase recycling motor HelD n=1 Tax=Ligilactobacillus acidipiscis TaxID=89059 RepID=UPI003868F6C8